MAVYVDEFVRHPGAKPPFERGSSHLTADSLEQLHAMAQAIGLLRRYYQPQSSPHYDLTWSKRNLALSSGAVFKPGRESARERIEARRATLAAAAHRVD